MSDCDIEASVHYRSARNPSSAIRSAILSQLEQKASNRRLQWRALCSSASVDPSSSLTTAQFCAAVKGFGSGIQLQACDVQLVLGGDGPITVQSFMASWP